MRVAAGHVAVRVFERHAVQLDAIAERRGRCRDVEELRAREIVIQPVRRSNGRAAITGHIPGDARARREIGPLLVHARLAGWETRITGIDQAGGRILEPLCLDALAEVVEDEIGDGAVVDVLAEVRLPPHAHVERDAILHAPCVLAVRRRRTTDSCRECRARHDARAKPGRSGNPRAPGRSSAR